jgi:hypothetical protein
MKTVKHIITILLFVLELNLVFAQEFKVMKRETLDGFKSFVDLPPLRMRVVYPSLLINLTEPRLYIYNSIYYLLLDKDKDNSLGFEFSTRRVIKANSESYYSRLKSGDEMDDEAPPQSEEGFLHREAIFHKEKVESGYFEHYFISSDGQKYGISVNPSETGGYFEVKAYTYIDSFQIIVKTSNSADTLAPKVSNFLYKELGLRNNDESEDLRMMLIFHVLRENLLHILKRIRLEKY